MSGLLKDFHLEKKDSFFVNLLIDEKTKLTYASSWDLNGKILNVTFLNGANINKSNLSFFEVPPLTNQTIISRLANKILSLKSNSTYYQIDDTSVYKNRSLPMRNRSYGFYNIDPDGFNNLKDFLEVQNENEKNLDFWIKNYFERDYVLNILPKVHEQPNERRLSISEFFGTLRKLPIPFINDKTISDSEIEMKNSQAIKQKCTENNKRTIFKIFNRKIFIFIGFIFSIIIFCLTPYKKIIDFAFLQFKMVLSILKNFLK